MYGTHGPLHSENERSPARAMWHRPRRDLLKLRTSGSSSSGLCPGAERARSHSQGHTGRRQRLKVQERSSTGTLTRRPAVRLCGRALTSHQLLGRASPRANVVVCRRDADCRRWARRSAAPASWTSRECAARTYSAAASTRLRRRSGRRTTWLTALYYASSCPPSIQVRVVQWLRHHIVAIERLGVPNNFCGDPCSIHGTDTSFAATQRKSFCCTSRPFACGPKRATQTAAARAESGLAQLEKVAIRPSRLAPLPTCATSDASRSPLWLSCEPAETARGTEKPSRLEGKHLRPDRERVSNRLQLPVAQHFSRP